jgi:hypothetical protein
MVDEDGWLAATRENDSRALAAPPVLKLNPFRQDSQMLFA